MFVYSHSHTHTGWSPPRSTIPEGTSTSTNSGVTAPDRTADGAPPPGPPRRACACGGERGTSVKIRDGRAGARRRALSADPPVSETLGLLRPCELDFGVYSQNQSCDECPNFSFRQLLRLVLHAALPNLISIMLLSLFLISEASCPGMFHSFRMLFAP